MAWLANQNLNYLIGGVAPRRRGTAHPNIVPYQSFATADGYLMLSVGNDGQFARFCAAAGQPQLAADPRYATNQGRVANRSELVPQVQQLLRARSTSDWLERLRKLPTCPADRSTISPRSSPSRRCGTAVCGSTCRTRRRDRSPGCATRPCSRARRSNTGGRRRCSGPTPTSVLRERLGLDASPARRIAQKRRRSADPSCACEARPRHN